MNKTQGWSGTDHWLSSVLYTLISVVLFGWIYPLCCWLLASIAFPFQAAGSLQITDAHRIIGSALAGQMFTHPEYLHGRPSAAGSGYDPLASGGTNLAPTSAKLLLAIRNSVQATRREEQMRSGAIPVDIVTSSASGLDPDISPAAAFLQAPRIAQARHLALSDVRRLLLQHVENPVLGILGEAHVNVLQTNLDLDREGRFHHAK